MISLLLFLFVAVNGHADWSYHGNLPPKEWKRKYGTCGGVNQSPIRIYGDDLVVDASMPAIKFEGYDVPIRARATKIRNNGHSFSIDVSDHDRFIDLGPGRYKLVDIHYHWGENDDYGSEHRIANLAYPLVAHFVHAKVGKTVKQAKKENISDGLAVLAVMYNISGKPNFELEKIVNGIKRVKSKEGSATLDSSISLLRLLPGKVDNFYRYKGSLTTPPCSEVVVWNIFVESAVVSRQQLKSFRELHTKDNTHVDNNFRPIQPLNDRKVHVREMVTIDNRPDGLLYFCDEANDLCQPCTDSVSQLLQCPYSKRAYESIDDCSKASTCNQGMYDPYAAQRFPIGRK